MLFYPIEESFFAMMTTENIIQDVESKSFIAREKRSF